MRVPYAMRALIGEIDKVNPKASADVRDADGYGVWRTLVLDPATTNALTPLLDELRDPRILSKDIQGGRYILRFVTDQRADDAREFGLDRAHRILSDGHVPDVYGISREQRHQQLRRLKVDTLRQRYGYRYDMRKAEIVEDILTLEGF